MLCVGVKGEVPLCPAAAVIECMFLYLLGVRGKMMKMRAQCDSAIERSEQLSKTLQETTERLNQTEEERNSLQR